MTADEWIEFYHWLIDHFSLDRNHGGVMLSDDHFERAIYVGPGEIHVLFEQYQKEKGTPREPK